MADNIDDMSAKGGFDGTKLLNSSKGTDISETEHSVLGGNLGRKGCDLFSSAGREGGVGWWWWWWQCCFPHSG